MNITPTSFVVHRRMSNLHSIVNDVSKGLQRILVIDKCKDTYLDSVEALRSLLLERGYEVAINNSMSNPKDLDNILKNTSILSILKNKKEATIVCMDTTSKKFTFPAKWKLANNRVIIVYIHTHLQKTPLSKKLFESTHTLSDGDLLNNSVTMANEIIAGVVKLEELHVHDLNLICLILLHNFYFCVPKLNDCLQTYESLAMCEQSHSTEEGCFSNIIQVLTLIAYIRLNGTRSRAFEFTQHLSRYSVHSGFKKKLIEKSPDLKDCTSFEDLLFDEKSDKLVEMRQSFLSSADKNFSALKLPK